MIRSNGHMKQSSIRANYIERLHRVRQQLVGPYASAGLAGRAGRMLLRLEARLARPPRLVIVGEVNGGKTTLANRLIGCEVLATDVVHNTRVPQTMRYAASPVVLLVDDNGRLHPIEAASFNTADRTNATAIELGLPLEILKSVEIVDMPGLMPDGAAIAHCRAVCARADIAVWCTVATQAWRGTEIAFWSAMATAGKPALLAITHSDLLDAADLQKVRDRVAREAAGRFAGIVIAGKDMLRPDTDGVLAAVLGLAETVDQARCKRAAGIVAGLLERFERAAGHAAIVADPRTIGPEELPSKVEGAAPARLIAGD